MLAVNNAGMSSEIPVEFFRQLVLLLWDFTIISANGNGGSNKKMAWGIDRIYNLALIIKKSVRGMNSSGTDDMVLSLLSLLSFQTSSSLQGLKINSNRYTDICELLQGTTLKHLILPHDSKNKEEIYAISQPTQLTQHTINTKISSSESDINNYHNVVNILSKDNAKISKCREVEGIFSFTPGPNNGPLGSWDFTPEKEYTDLSLLIHESWESLSHLSYETMLLPISISNGNKLCACMMVKSILNIAFMSCRNSQNTKNTQNNVDNSKNTKNIGNNEMDIVSSVENNKIMKKLIDVKTVKTVVESVKNVSGVESVKSVTILPLFPLSTARWALTLYSAFLNTVQCTLQISNQSSRSMDYMKRILSCSDNLVFNSYTMLFCDYQLSFRLAVLSLSSIFDHLSSTLDRTLDLNSEYSELQRAIGSTLCCLLRIPITTTTIRALKTSTDFFTYLSNNMKNDSQDICDGSYFWSLTTVGESRSNSSSSSSSSSGSSSFSNFNSGTDSGISSRSGLGSGTGDSLSPRALAQLICARSLEISASIISTLDRNTSLSVGIDDINLVGNDDNLSQFSSRSIIESARHLVSLCDTINTATHTPTHTQELSLIPEPGSESRSDSVSDSMSVTTTTLSFSECFEPLPGKDKKQLTGSGSMVKRSTVLFDKSSGVWRLGNQGSRDRVLASMRAVQYAKLSNVREDEEEGEGEEEGDGSEVEEVEVEVGDDDEMDVEDDNDNVDDFEEADDDDEFVPLARTEDMDGSEGEDEEVEGEGEGDDVESDIDDTYGGDVSD